MRPRPAWKGYLRLSLVSCAVALYNANTTTEKISFNQINKKTGNRVRQRLIDESTEETVDRANIVKGYEVSKGQYVLIEDEDFDGISLESKQTVELESFVPASEIDQVYLDGSHYLAPDDRISAEAFSVIRDAMAARGVVGIGRVVMNRRERILVLQARGKGILATTLRYPYEVRQEGDVFAEIADVEMPPEAVELATSLIAKREGHFDPTVYGDRYEEALVELIKAKSAGQEFVQPEVKAPFAIIDFMEALKRSVQKEAPKPTATKTKAPRKGKAAEPAEITTKPEAAPKTAAAGRGRAKKM